MLRKLNCYFSGHDYSIRSDEDHVFLRCDVCGHASQGWSLGAQEPTSGTKHSALTRIEQLLVGRRQPAKIDLR